MTTVCDVGGHGGAAVKRLLEVVPGGGEWSLARLLCDRAFSDLVRTWFTGLELDRFESAISGVGGFLGFGDSRIGSRGAAGALLLARFALGARECCTEGRLWGPLQRHLASDNPALVRRLFPDRSHPDPRALDAVERACRSLRLRHAFDIRDDEGGPGHRWYTTVLLQVGHTRLGLLQNAESWLSDQQTPRAVRLLTGAGSGSLRSGSFIHYWSTLHALGRRNMSLQDAVRRLGDSPWCLGDSGDILDRVARIEPGRLAAAGTGRTELADLEPAFLGTPRWSLERGEPVLIAPLVGLAEIGMGEPRLDVTADGRRVGMLLRTDDELRLLPAPKSLGDAERLEVELPVRAEIRVVLTTASGRPVAEQTLQPLGEDDGSVVRAYTLQADGTARAYRRGAVGSTLLAFPPEAELTPAAETSPAGEALVIAALPAGQAEDAAVRLDGNVVWSGSALGTLTPPAAEPILTVAARVGEYCIDVEHDQSSTVIGVRSGGTVAARIEARPGHASARIASLKRDLPGTATLDVTFTGVRGLWARRLRATVNDPGLYRRTTLGFERVRATDEVDVGELGRGELFAAAPAGGAIEKDHDFCFLEGDHVAARVPGRGQPRFDADGLGAPLELWRGPLNGERIMQVADSVVDHGALEPDADLDAAEGVVRLRLREGWWVADPGSLWCFALTFDGSTVQVPLEREGDRDFIARVPNGCAAAALALAGGGIRLGAVWRSTWPGCLKSLEAQSAQYLAAAVRWFRLPVMATRPRSTAFRRFLPRHTVPLVRGWLSAAELQVDGLVSNESPRLPDVWDQAGLRDSAWAGALRSLFRDMPIEPEHLEEAINAFAGDAPAEGPKPTAYAAARLARIDPVFACNALLVTAVPCLGSRARDLAAEAAEWLADAEGEGDFNGRLELLVEESAKSLSVLLGNAVDTGFVRGISRDLRDHRRRVGFTPAKPPSRLLDRPGVRLLADLSHGRRLGSV